MRDIAFRGKAVPGSLEEAGKWIYGQYITNTYKSDGLTRCEIGEMIDGHPQVTQVQVDSVGQYTGFRDRNGHVIFEGDILKYTTKVNTGMNAGKVHEEYCKVVWSEVLGAWCVEPIGEYHLNITCTRFLYERHGYHAYENPPDVEFYADIVGNIHDNPELL